MRLTAKITGVHFDALPESVGLRQWLPLQRCNSCQSSQTCAGAAACFAVRYRATASRQSTKQDQAYFVAASAKVSCDHRRLLPGSDQRERIGSLQRLAERRLACTYSCCPTVLAAACCAVLRAADAEGPGLGVPAPDTRRHAPATRRHAPATD